MARATKRTRGTRMLAVLAAAAVAGATGCGSDRPATVETPVRAQPVASVHYLEIVTPEVEPACALYEGLHGVSFGPPDPSLGQARVARKPDGTVIGIRTPLAEHERPMVRAYLAVDDIGAAVKAAEQRGATIAYPPTKQGEHGSFAIVVQDEVEHGLWQR